MSTFKVQIEDLVGSVGDDILLTDVLTNVAAEIVNLLPDDMLWMVVKDSEDQATNGFATPRGRIIDVVKENGTDGEYISCKKVNPIFERKVQDVNSLFYPSAEEPIYFLKDGKVYVYGGTVVGSSPNAMKVFYVDYPTVTSSDSDITDFPDGYVQAVILGAAVRVRLRQLADKRSSYPSNLSLPSVPVAPASPSFTYNDATIGTISSTTIGSFGTAPVYTGPVVTPDFSSFDAEVSNDDYEEAQTIGVKINAQINEFQARIQDALGDFKEDNVAYQASIQKEIAQAELDQQRLIEAARMTTDVNKLNEIQELQRQVQEYQGELSRHSNEIQSYSANVSALVTDYGAKVQRYGNEHQLMFAELGVLQTQYKQALTPLLSQRSK